MTTRRAAAIILLFAFPVTTFAQGGPAASVPVRDQQVQSAGRIDLKNLKLAEEPAPNRTFTPRVPAAPRHDFEWQTTPTSCADSEAKGRTDADKFSKPWFFGGVASGTAVGLLGAGAITGVAAAIKPKPKSVPAGVDAACYRQGFASKARHEGALAALLGGLVGTVVWALILTAASD
jgi:hypothetical protein